MDKNVLKTGIFHEVDKELQYYALLNLFKS